MADQIIAAARANHAAAQDLQLPDGLKLNPAWDAYRQKMATAIQGFSAAEDAVRFAQVGSNSGFDHRIHNPRYAEAVTNYKIDALTREFGADIVAQPWFREHQHSAPSSVVTIADRQVSTIFLTHAYYFLRIRQAAGRMRRVVEVGSGYGGLAKIFCDQDADISYILVDLPESLFFAEVFLRSFFPDRRFTYIADASQAIPEGPGITFVPLQNRNVLRGASCDILANTGSFQEMTEAFHRSWMDLVERPGGLATRFLYSFNYFLVNRHRHRELGLGAATPICPILDSGWRCLHFDINPPAASVDARTRNWLDVVVERVALDDPAAAASDAAAAAGRYPLGTVPWLRHMWMAIWYSAEPAYISRMLAALKLIREGRALTISNQRSRRRVGSGRLAVALAETLAPSERVEISKEDIALDGHTNRLYRAIEPARRLWREALSYYIRSFIGRFSGKPERDSDISHYSEILFYEGILKKQK